MSAATMWRHAPFVIGRAVDGSRTPHIIARTGGT
jgi:hypothetical protein